MKPTNNTGYDHITSRLLKLGIHIISVLLTHAINVSIRNNTFPTSQKIHRILPILKPDKDANEPNSFRPITNLPILEKVYEQYWKEELEK